MPFFYLSFLQHSFAFLGVFQRPRLRRELQYLRGSPLDLLDYGHRDQHLVGWNWNQNPLRPRSYETFCTSRQLKQYIYKIIQVCIYSFLSFDVLDRDLLQFAHLLPRWRPQDVEVQPGRGLESLIMSSQPGKLGIKINQINKGGDMVKICVEFFKATPACGDRMTIWPYCT